jgi:hypothetical protein
MCCAVLKHNTPYIFYSKNDTYTVKTITKTHITKNIFSTSVNNGNRNSVTAIVTKLRAANPKFVPRQRQETFLQTAQTGCDTPSFLFNGCRGSFQEVKRQGCTVDHSPPPKAVFKNEWIYTSVPPTCLNARGQGQIYFY